MSNPYGPPGGQGPQQWGGQPYGGVGPGQDRYSGSPGQYGYAPPGQQRPPGIPGPAVPPPGPAQPGGHPPPPGNQPQGGFHQPVPAPQPPPGGFGEPGSPEVPVRRKKRVLPWLLGGVALLVVAGIVLFLGFVTPGWFTRTVFDAGSVQKGVQQILRDAYNIDGVGAASCPSGQPVRQGHTYDCRVAIDGEQRTVTITVKDAEGTYEVGHPK